jgi:hypothetical protein
MSVSVCSILCSSSSPCASMAASASSFWHSTWLSSACFDTRSAFFVRAHRTQCLCVRALVEWNVNALVEWNVRKHDWRLVWD